MEYNTLDSLELNESGDAALGSGGEETRKLEEMLILKNRQLEGKATEAKRAADGWEKEVKTLKQQFDDLTRKSLEQGALIAKLEEELYQKNGGPRDSRGFSAVHLSALLETEDETQGTHAAVHDSPSSPQSPLRRPVAASQPDVSSNCMVAAVAEQRDRSSKTCLSSHARPCTQ